MVDPNLRASIQEIKKHGFFHGFHWYDLENSISTESKDELINLLADIKKEIDKEDLKEREEREKLSPKKKREATSGQPKNVQNLACLTEVTEEEKKQDQTDPIDSDKFSQVCEDFDEITPQELLQPRSAGLPFKMKFLAPNVLNDTDNRINVSDFSVRKNMQAFKDF